MLFTKGTKYIADLTGSKSIGRILGTAKTNFRSYHVQSTMSIILNNRSHNSSGPSKITNTTLSINYKQIFRQQHSLASNKTESVHIKPYVDPHLSYAHGRSIRELRYLTLGSLIEARVLEKPDSLAIGVYDQKVEKTYKELNHDIDQLVYGMALKLGLKRGDAVGLYSYNSYEALLVYYACNKLGLILNPFNPSYKSFELNYVLQKSNIKCLFMPGLESTQSSQNDHWSEFHNPELLQLAKDGKLNLSDIVNLDGKVPKLDPAYNINISTWTDITATPKDDSIEMMLNSVSSDDLYCIYYTSGTTGTPKGASITQFNAINCLNLTGPKFYLQRPNNLSPIEPKLCCPLPLFHAYAGIAGALMPFIETGGPIIFTGAKYKISSIIETISQYNCNILYVTPTILIDLLTFVENSEDMESIIDNLASLRTIIVGGAKIIPETINKCHRLLKQLEDFRIIYGSSENGVIATMQTCMEHHDTKLHTVGSPLDLTEVRIVDPKTNELKLLGEPGEVQTRGFNTMAGYLGEPERTREVITESRWYRTGDLGIMDARGSIQIVGRIKELIIKGGENIYPAEVESVLHEHEIVEDAQVFGVPDKRFGEEVAVWVKLRTEFRTSTLDESLELKFKNNLLSYCKTKLSYFKVPKYVIFVDDFPMTPVKKIKKFEMRAKTVEMLNLID